MARTKIGPLSPLARHHSMYSFWILKISLQSTYWIKTMTWWTIKFPLSVAWVERCRVEQAVGMWAVSSSEEGREQLHTGWNDEETEAEESRPMRIEAVPLKAAEMAPGAAGAWDRWLPVTGLRGSRRPAAQAFLFSGGGWGGGAVPWDPFSPTCSHPQRNPPRSTNPLPFALPSVRTHHPLPGTCRTGNSGRAFPTPAAVCPGESLLSP